MRPLAHSARPNQGISPQLYAAHAIGATRRAVRNARIAGLYCHSDLRSWLLETVRTTAPLHDLGKLDRANQEALRKSATAPLEYQHQDAGVRYLLGAGHLSSAVLVFSHHIGLPALQKEAERREHKFRCSPDARSGAATNARTDRFMQTYIELHRNEVGSSLPPNCSPPRWRPSGFGWRCALSCLVDADHADTARHYSQEPDVHPARRRWAERLAALDRYVNKLGSSSTAGPERLAIRRSVYEAAAGLACSPGLYECDSAVGTGKTTAIMAHLLRAAMDHHLRHVIVVLPYTNIIDQSVSVYRKALVLPGEDSERVVAAHHHQADFESEEARHLATLWDAPIIVTTAVQFFETLASCQPARLRKLHQLPGSALFIDEAHAAIPAQLWPQTWLWANELVSKWRCHAVFASGSLARFWTERAFCDPPLAGIPNLLPEALRREIRRSDACRVQYRRVTAPMSVNALIEFVESHPGPRLVILNTVKSAAVVAKSLLAAGSDVLHLSTALAPRHRRGVLDEVRERTKSGSARSNWTLVATSCVEAGVDLSFRTAIRELASACSIIQIGGRSNRHGDPDPGVVFVVTLSDDRLTRNRDLETTARVADGLFRSGDFDRLDPAALCTKALQQELCEHDAMEGAVLLKRAEHVRDFPEVAQRYKVIDDDSVMVVVDRDLADRISHREQIDRFELLELSVRVHRSNVKRFAVAPFAFGGELYRWTLRYEPEFLGYMAGVMDAEGAAAGEFLSA